MKLLPDLAGHDAVGTVTVDGEPMAAEWCEAHPGPWWVRATDWNGDVVYDGPAPVPDEMCTITLVDLAAGHLYTFEMRTQP